MRRIVVRAALFVVLAANLAPASADEPEDDAAANARGGRFTLGIGVAYAGFSTTFEQVRLGTRERIFVSLEGDLGLPASQTVPVVSLLARVGRKSYVAANLGRFRRSESLLQLDEEIILDDLVIDVGGNIELFFNVTDLDISYGHAFLDDDRVRIIGTLGLSLLDLDIGVIVEGSYRIGDVADSGTFEVSESLLAPVPLVGVVFDVDLAGGWILSSSVDFFYAPVGEITANAWRARIHVRYEFSRTVAVHLGYGTFDIEVDDNADDARSTIAYTMNGFAAGLTLTF
jgi:opacity protein-like surface antigen